MTSSAPVRVRLRYGDLPTFVQRFAPNVTRGGIFLATRTPRHAGDVFNFEVQLATGQVALSGTGKVIWVKEFDPAAPQKPHGMGVQFVHIDPGSRETLNQILRSKGSSRPGAAGENGRTRHSTTGPLAVVDANVDLVSEFGLEETAIRRAVDRRWVVSGAADDELDELLKPDAPEPVTLAQALAELPRMLDPTARRRSGSYRALEITSSGQDRATERTRPAVSDDDSDNESGPRRGPEGNA